MVVLYRFDNTFSNNLIEIFNFVFNCRFYFVFLVVFNFLYKDPVWLAWIAEPMFWFYKIDDGFHGFENNCFPKWKKKNTNFAILFLLLSVCCLVSLIKR